MTIRPKSSAPLFRRVAVPALALSLAAGIVGGSALPASAAEAPIDGARSAGDPMFPNVGNGGYDALDYDVDIAWTPNPTQSGTTIAGSIVASTTMTAHAAQPLRSFSLDFEGLEVDSVTVDGVPAQWTREVDADAIKFKLIVTPATPVSGEFTTVVTYHGEPSSHTDADGSSEGWNRTSDGATLLGQPVGMMTGYPHNNTPADKATYTFTLDIPTTLNNVAGTAPGPAAAVSVGELQSKTPSTDGTRTTWVWRHALPMASELALVSIGKYDVIESEVELTGGRTIPAWSFMDSALSTGNKTTIANRVAQLGEIIRNLETLYGAYPGNSTGVVVDTVPRGINYALETQDRSFFPSTGAVAGSTLIHELVHQWYGNNVGPTTWTDIWVAEGMAEWAPVYYASTEGFGTDPTTAEQVWYEDWERVPADDGAWAIAPGDQTDSADLYGFQTYSRSAQFWAALRIAIGDETFFELIEQWQARHALTATTGADVLALAEELSGRDLTAFYQDWILDADKPAWPDKLDLSLSTTPAEGPLARGDEVTYTLSATNTGFGPLNASTATIDLSGVLTRAAIDPAALPAGVTLDGSTLTWAVPVTPASAPPATVSFDAVVTDTASGGGLEAVASVASLGGTCVSCASSLAVQAYPVASAPPVIAGTAQVGATLTARTDGWTDGTSFAYTWQVDGVAVDGADASTFTVPESALGAEITVTVTGSLEGYLPETLTSDPVGPVIAAAIVPTPTPTPRPGADEVGLAATGAEPFAAASWALALLVAGAGGLLLARRRTVRS